ncbi:MAG: hypothetical protein GXX99_05445 [Clostridiales bacterium]|nr:hypothetical protein [Clostridiales bacterium]
MIALLKEWVVTLGGAAIMVGLAQGLIPAKAMEREIKLVLSLVMLLAFFSTLTKMDLSALEGWQLGEDTVQAFGVAGQEAALSGALLLTREELKRTLEQDLSDAFGQPVVVAGMQFGGEEQNVRVERIYIVDLGGVEEQEMSRYLSNRFGLESEVVEVNAQ